MYVVCYVICLLYVYIYIYIYIIIIIIIIVIIVIMIMIIMIIRRAACGGAAEERPRAGEEALSGLALPSASRRRSGEEGVEYDCLGCRIRALSLFCRTRFVCVRKAQTRSLLGVHLRGRLQLREGVAFRITS